LAQSTSPVTPAETARLAQGDTIERPQELDREGHHYVGGVTYTVVEATPAELESVFYDVSAYKTILPHTLSARLFARLDDDIFVEVRQGNALAQGSYTLRMRKSGDHREVRFWVDRQRPHDIEDAWGFFRVEPLAPAPASSVLSSSRRSATRCSRFHSACARTWGRTSGRSGRRRQRSRFLDAAAAR
jgi:hypothetical protein